MENNEFGKLRTGIGGCEASLDMLNYAYEKGIRVIDSGRGYQSNGTKVPVFDKILGQFMENHKEDREEFFIINKLPLFDEHYKEKFGWSLYNCTDEQLEFGIREVIKDQMKDNNVEYYDAYLLHALYDMQYSSNWVGLEEETELYKRIFKVLLKLKEEGKIKHLGFSAHITFERLHYFVSEIEATFGNIMDVAEVSFNIFNDKGFSQSNPSMFSKMHGIRVWDAIGEKGIHWLKERGYTIVNCRGHEGGQIKAINESDDWFRWCNKFIYDNKDIDIVLAGTNYKKHLDDMLNVETNEYLKDIPDMRIIDTEKPVHCME